MSAAVIHGSQILFQANNLVLHTAMEHFRRNCWDAEQSIGHRNGSNSLPHIITSNVEHDSVKLAAEHLQKDGKAGRRPSCRGLFRLIPGEWDVFYNRKKLPCISFLPFRVLFINVFLSQMWHSCLCPRSQAVWRWMTSLLQCVLTRVSSLSCWLTMRQESSWWENLRLENLTASAT